METKLIELYLLICTCYDNQPLLNQQRLSNFKPLFTDQELLTRYLFGHLQGLTSQRRISTYFAAHWRAWFPALLTYQAFNRRLQLLPPAFELLIEDHLQAAAKRQDLAAADRLIDSLPVMLAQGSRANRARVGAADRRCRLLCDQANPLLWPQIARRGGAPAHAVAATGAPIFIICFTTRFGRVARV